VPIPGGQALLQSHTVAPAGDPDHPVLHRHCGLTRETGLRPVSVSSDTYPYDRS
jgi:hypothetical protein